MASSPGHETILLVEDEQGVRQFTKIAVQRYGYRVLEAHSAEAALALLDSLSEPLHLLLSDVILSGMDGRELAQCLTRDRPDLRVLFMSGYTEGISATNGILDPAGRPWHQRHLFTSARVLGPAVCEA